MSKTAASPVDKPERLMKKVPLNRLKFLKARRRLLASMLIKDNKRFIPRCMPEDNTLEVNLDRKS